MKHETSSSSPYFIPENSIAQKCAYILEHAAQSLHECAQHIPELTEKVITKIRLCKGKIIFCGIGKSGLVARKCSATFSSLGIPSFFIHPLDALHGDMGAVTKDDISIIFSKSAEGEELKKFSLYLSHIGVETILISCKGGTLSKKVSYPLLLTFKQEYSLFPHAPLASAALMMVFCDALALCVASLKNFNVNDFALRHPAGSLGSSLLLTVESFMYVRDHLPLLCADDMFKKIISEITLKKLGVGIVVSDDDLVMGVITDGDLRRACDLGESVFQKKASEIMSPRPLCVSPDLKAIDALKIMKDASITSLIVVHENRIRGLVRMHEVIAAGITL